MTTRYVDWCSFTKLPCAWGSTKDVIVCLQSSALVAQPDEFCDDSKSTIEGSICQVFSNTDCCGPKLWHYKISYDDTQLAAPSTPLSSADITGVFCLDCFTTWISEERGSDVTVVTEDDGTQTLISEHGCEYAIASTEVPFTVTDTNSVDLTVNPSAPQNLSADVKISPDADNIISIHANGLYATADAQELLAVTDTNSVNLTINGTIPQTLSADVKISATSNNLISIAGDGLLARDFYSVTTAQLNAAIAGNALQPGATYEINDFVQGRIVAGAKVYVRATSVNQITSSCDVLTTYDPQPWRGVYNVNTNLLTQLTDNLGNTCKQENSIFFSCIEDFDWGNSCYTFCLNDNSYWLVDYGITDAFFQNIELRGDGGFQQFDMRGWDPPSNRFIFNMLVEYDYQLTLTNNTGIGDTVFSSPPFGPAYTSLISNNGSGIGGSTIIGGGVLDSEDIQISLHECDVSYGGSIDASNATGGFVYFYNSSIINFSYVLIENSTQFIVTGTLITGLTPSGGVSLHLSNLSNANPSEMTSCFIHASLVDIINSATLFFVDNSSFTSGSVTNVVNGGTVNKCSNNIGIINTNGHNLTNVYVNGNVTANCTADNTDTAKDYFNSSIV